MSCPRCGRPVAVARASCLYCGAPLAAGAVEEAARAREALVAGLPAAPPAPAEERALVVVALDGVDPTALARALAVPAYDAAQWARRGGYHLYRASRAAEAAAAAGGLRAQGLVVHLLDEAAVRAAAEPVALTGGRFADGVLEARTAAGTVVLRGGEIALVVKGPIAREHPASDARLRLAPTATLEPGYRFHLHPRSAPRPLEIDPFDFDFPPDRAGESSLLAVGEWVAALAAGAPVDDGFRRMAPAMAPAAPAAGSRASRAEEALRRGGGRKDAALDNLAQFRFYSAWRGAVERAARR